MSISIAENKFILGDCVEFMKTIPDKHFDLTLTDPPYGVGLEYEDYSDTRDNLEKLLVEFIPQLIRVSKFALITPGCNNLNLWHSFDYMFIIYQPASPDISRYGMNTYQPVLVYGNEVLKGLKNRWTVIQNTESKPITNHPCPKPLKLWEKILLRGSANEGDLVFDPFLGSGTTAIVCHNQNRNFVGCELSKKYYDYSLERFKNHISQERLFEPKQIEVIKDVELF